MSALCTQADLEKLLQIEFGTDPDPIVTRLITWASAIVEAWLDRPVESVELTETFTRAGGLALPSTRIITRYPITAVASISENGTDLTDEWEVRGSQVLARVSGGYPSHWTAPVVVVYDTGWASVPDVISQAVAGIAARMFKAGYSFAAAGARSSPDIKSETLGDYSVTYQETAAAAEAKVTAADAAILGPFRNYTGGMA